jgi:hypothetical protein
MNTDYTDLKFQVVQGYTLIDQPAPQASSRESTN